jgi:hypothetical protein
MLYNNYNAINKHERREIWNGIDVILEAKTTNSKLDTNKVTKDNPFMQLLNYLRIFKLNYGFLTNGQQWCLIDNSKLTAEKRYLFFDLNRIITDNKFNYFELFWQIFHADNFKKSLNNQSNILFHEQNSEQYRIKLENNLKNLIYGFDGEYSFFEEIGKALYNSTAIDQKFDFATIFENTLYLEFRLLFLAYLEDKYSKLLNKHEGYEPISLWNIYNQIDSESIRHTGWARLKRLFKILNSGEIESSIPLINGGLFDPIKATLLENTFVFNNILLKRILQNLLEDKDGYKRDFSSISPSHLGSIYEGLLEFQFRIDNKPTWVWR